MRQNRGIYEYTYVYVYDLEIVARDPNILIRALEKSYEFKITLTVPILFHLEFNFFHNNNGILCFVPHKYIENMAQTFMGIFDSNPNLNKTIKPPLEQGGHPELDT